MAIQSLQCPNCMGQIQLDDTRDTVVCDYCDSLIQIRDYNEKIRIEHVYDNSSKINNSITLADRAFASGNYNECYNYCCAVLECDADHFQAVFLKGLCAAYLSFTRMRELDTAIEEAKTLISQNAKDPCAEYHRMFTELLGYIRHTYDSECKRDEEYVYEKESAANRVFVILATLIRLCRSCVLLIGDDMILQEPALEGEKKECLKYAMMLCDRGGAAVKYIAGYETVQKGNVPVPQPIHKKLSSPFKDVQNHYYDEFKTAYNHLPTTRRTLYEHDCEIERLRMDIEYFDKKFEEYLQANPDIARDYKQNPANFFRRMFSQAKTRKQILRELPPELATLRQTHDLSEERLRVVIKAKNEFVRQNIVK